MIGRYPGRCAFAVMTIGLAALLGGCSSIEPVPASTSLGVSGAEIPGSFEHGLFIAEAMIDGVGPFRLVVDTGSDAVALRPEAVERLDIEPAGRSIITDGAGSHGVTAGAVRIDSLKLGAFEVRGLDAIVHGFSSLQELFDAPIDGVVGFPVFSEVALVFDQRAASVRVVPPPAEPPPGPGAFRMSGKRARIDLPLFGRSFRVLVDTGANTTLDLRRKDLAPDLYTAVGAQSARTLRSSVSRELVELDRAFEFAGRSIDDASVYIGGRSRILGTAWMKPFRVTFDQINRVIVFQPSEQDPGS